MLLFALSAIVLGTSCSDDDTDTPSPYNTTIQGVNLTTVDATPAGSIGNPDAKNFQENYFRMTIYPNPSVNVMYTDVLINNPEPVTLNAKLISVVYPGAPEGSIIENTDRRGWIARTGSRDIPAFVPDSTSTGIGSIFPGQHVQFLFEVSSLPKGFYRLYIETSKGDLFWDNAWVVY